MSSAFPDSPPETVVGAATTCFVGLDPLAAYRYIARSGIRYVEVPAMPAAFGIKYDLTTFSPEAMVESDIDALKSKLQRLELIPVTVSAFCDLADVHQVLPMCRRIDFAHKLGARYIISDASELKDAAQRRELINSLRFVGDYAREKGVRIALETHEGPMCNGTSGRQLLEEVDHRSVGMNYDTGNIYYYNDGVDPAEDITKVADLVTHVHLKDTLGGRNEWRFCALGDGRVNFPRVIDALRSAGYQGPYSLEVEGEHGEAVDGEVSLRRVVRSLEYLSRIGLWEGTSAAATPRGQ
jgi:sugar phosphate isomerase/epimerase